MDWLEPEDIADQDAEETSAVVSSGSRGRSATLAAIAVGILGLAALFGLTNQGSEVAEPPPTTPAPPPTTTTVTTTTTAAPPASSAPRDPFPGESDFETGPPIGLLVFFEPSAADADIASFLETADNTPLVERLTVESTDDDFGARTAVNMALRPGTTSTDVVDLTIRFEAQSGVDVVWPLVVDTMVRVWMNPESSEADISAVTALLTDESAVLSQTLLDQEATFEEYLGLFANSTELASEVSVDDLPFAIVIRVDRYNPHAETRRLIESLEQMPGVQNVGSSRGDR